MGPVCCVEGVGSSSQTQNFTQSPAHCQVPQRAGRSAVEERTIITDRVVSRSVSIEMDHSSYLHSSSQSVRHRREHKTPHLRKSHSRSKGVGSRCVQCQLEGSRCLCISSNQSAVASRRQGSLGPLSSAVGTSSLANAGLVLGSSPLVSGRTQTTATDVSVFDRNVQMRNLHVWLLDSAPQRRLTWCKSH